MNISSDILRRGLQEDMTVAAFGNVTGELSFSKILFMEEDKPPENGAIYLLSGDTKISKTYKKVKSTLVIIGDYEVELIRTFESVFIVEESQTIYNLYNKVQNILSYYEEWSSNLRKELQVGSNVQAMIDIGTSILNNPLILQDRNYSVIAVSEAYAESPFLEPLLDSNNIPLSTQSNQASDENIEKETSVVPLQITGRDALYINIFQQGKYQYRLTMLETDNKIQISDSSLLEYLSNFIHLAIGYVTDEEKEFMTLPYVMKGILSGEFRDSEYIEQKLSEFGWAKGNECLCLKVHVDIPDYKNRVLRFMSDRLKAIFTEACIFEYENSIAMFFNLNLSNCDAAKIESIMSGFLQDNNMKAGISNTFSDFGYFKQYYTQAGVAIKLGPRIKPYQNLHKFSEVIELYILESCTEELPARMICEPGLLKLRDYDKKNNQDFYNTLYVYLKNNMRSVTSAKELYIHRSTFLYRLERIKEIMGTDIDEKENQWYLLLSYKMLEKDNSR